MNAQDVLWEIAREYGWNKRSIPKRSIPIRPSSTVYWPTGYQISLHRGDGAISYGRIQQISVYFPDEEPWLIRLNELRHNDLGLQRFDWPYAGIDFDLRDPESIDRLRACFKERSTGPQSIRERIRGFFFNLLERI